MREIQSVRRTLLSYPATGGGGVRVEGGGARVEGGGVVERRWVVVRQWKGTGIAQKVGTVQSGSFHFTSQ